MEARSRERCKHKLMCWLRARPTAHGCTRSRVKWVRAHSASFCAVAEFAAAENQKKAWMIASDPIRYSAHDVGCHAHHPAYGERQAGTTGSFRHLGVPRFIFAHLLDNRATLGIDSRKPVHVIGQMLFDL